MKTVVVMPAYNAAVTLQDTAAAIPREAVDEIVVVDDSSDDSTVEIAQELGFKTIRHPHNAGYGANQKTCYMEALRDGADIVVMLHPDGQYNPQVIPQMIAPIEAGRAHIVLGSRFLRPGGARTGGMPVWKIAGNRFLTAIENLILKQGLSEYHTGYRAYSRHFLETVPFLRNANGFVFDTQILAQATAFGFRIHEVPVETRYFRDASSVGLQASITYGIGTLAVVASYMLHRLGLRANRLFVS